MAFGDTINSVKKQASNVEDKAAGLVPADHFTDWFEGALSAYWGKIFQLLSRLTSDSAEAEDLTLEVFWRLYINPPQTRQNPGGWLYRVATNLGYNALRSRKRRQRYEERAGSFVWEEQAPENPARAFEKAEEVEQVQKVLAKMKLRSSQILLLRHSGLSYKEVAEAVGIDPASVGTLLTRAEKEFMREYRKLIGD
jgi:RNA polymerase sigma-70 factor, ECF subfamily